MQFLCNHHRHWLSENLQHAGSLLLQHQESAEYFRGMTHWQEALPFAGCAFEIAGLRVQDSALFGAQSMIDYTASALVLADTLTKLELHKQATSLYDAVISSLVVMHQSCWHDTQLAPVSQACLNTLREYQQFDQSLDNQRQDFPYSLSQVH